MRFAIITHVAHKIYDGRYFAYGPYVREMDIWSEFVSEVEIVAPLASGSPNPIDLAYASKKVTFTKVASFDLLGPKAIFFSLLRLPLIAFRIFGSMRRADHIHLRCPGNMGLLGCFVQILFPSKPKTAKYAGNWDLSAAQPWSYRLQKWLLNNTFLTRNMKVLVYGEWEGSSGNVVPFFTATYRESDISEIAPRDFETGVRLLFVGSLSVGKRPSYAIELVEALQHSGVDACLDIFGEGAQREMLESHIVQKGLSESVRLHGNRPEAEVRQAYKRAHFLLLPSRSEGWPKVVAEAMFWSAVPVSTNVSCVPWMLGSGKRGLELSLRLEDDRDSLLDVIRNKKRFHELATASRDWSQRYTLDKFSTEVKHLLHGKK
ncbi:glycosyltransferase family 4 protein [Flavobacterium selenitireducens]|uniref:glycosyltransferase family 4 protein n=1 Tax=Flavobacterium selenitireducens TaxID=2722704 RepID=UPI00168B64F6|nr:glycosyltransferase family 4 protein [Flavobacterium selenitireducens]MBD3583428.1 glycosyltransferase family 4 protein [Flavobacterium selenitireducens]